MNNSYFSAIISTVFNVILSIPSRSLEIFEIISSFTPFSLNACMKHSSGSISSKF